MASSAFANGLADAATQAGASVAMPSDSLAVPVDSRRVRHAPSEPAGIVLSAHDIATVLALRFHVGLEEAERIGRAVIDAARREALSPMLLLAVIAVESGFDRHALSEAGAVGLMQVLPSQHKDRVRHAAQLWDTDTNVSVGSSILHEYLTAADGDLNGALVRYSGGARGYPARVTTRLNQIEVAFRGRPPTVSINENAAKY
ncbi:transglycosylase SLT domain-containing protein [Trinickia sp. NRRL B-1857]|uniref:lytic transglycosylase domain-containing protein n=1 Tax=Trinickia sp. NRRL B-1857 TaxID=3162879 RepID=UPI003D264DB0